MKARRPASLARILLLALAVLAAAPFLAPARAEMAMLPPGPTSELTVETRTGIYPYQVEIADDDRERSQGLMYRKTLERDRGMLFDMGVNRRAGFWMRNTYIPLDIIFIDRQGKVDSIAYNTRPLSEAIVSSTGPVRFVLELKAGSAKDIGLSIGDRIRHPIIDAVAGN